MKKPYWFKKSYIKYKINNILFSILQVFIPKNKTGKKVLITESDICYQYLKMTLVV